jgi:hypothetical protein
VAQRLARREARGGSVSDGRRELVAAQAAAWEAASPEVAESLLRVDGGQEGEVKLAQVLERLEGMGYDPTKQPEE